MRHAVPAIPGCRGKWGCESLLLVAAPSGVHGFGYWISLEVDPLKDYLSINLSAVPLEYLLTSRVADLSTVYLSTSLATDPWAGRGRGLSGFRVQNPA